LPKNPNSEAPRSDSESFYNTLENRISIRTVECSLYQQVKKAATNLIVAINKADPKTLLKHSFCIWQFLEHKHSISGKLIQFKKYNYPISIENRLWNGHGQSNDGKRKGTVTNSHQRNGGNEREHNGVGRNTTRRGCGGHRIVLFIGIY